MIGVQKIGTGPTFWWLGGVIETQPVTPIIILIGEGQRWAADAQESGWLRRAWARNREDGKARWGAHGISRILRSELPGRLVTRAAEPGLMSELPGRLVTRAAEPGEV